MATSAQRPRGIVTVTTSIDLDFGDTDLLVRQFSDGMWSISVDDSQLLIDSEQMQRVVGAFLRIGKELGWT